MAKSFYNKKKHKKRLFIVLTAVILLCLSIVLFTVRVIQPVIDTVSREVLKSYTYEIINKSVSEVIDSNPEFAELTEVLRDGDGNITLIQTNSAAVNNLARSVTERSQLNLSKIADIGVNIPIGSLSGIPFFAGRGPNLNIKSIQVANVDTTFSSSLMPAGINQTIHKFFVEVTASVNVIIPGADNRITTVTQVLVGENIIVGKVPNVYFGTQSADFGLNLIP